jgi:hypothetical protein
MTELEFANEIDGRFPYEDLEQGLGLAEQGCNISPNAAFAVLHELARPGRGVAAPVPNRIAVLDAVAARLDHPLASPVVALARRVIYGETPTVDESLDLMRTIAPFRGQYAALAIAYMSCDDRQGRATKEEGRIRASWHAA